MCRCCKSWEENSTEGERGIVCGECSEGDCMGDCRGDCEIGEWCIGDGPEVCKEEWGKGGESRGCDKDCVGRDRDR